MKVEPQLDNWLGRGGTPWYEEDVKGSHLETSLLSFYLKLVFGIWEATLRLDVNWLKVSFMALSTIVFQTLTRQERLITNTVKPITSFRMFLKCVEL